MLITSPQPKWSWCSTRPFGRSKANPWWVAKPCQICHSRLCITLWRNPNPVCSAPKAFYLASSREKSCVFSTSASFLGVGVLLASYTWGRDALRLTGMTDDEIVEECLEGLAKIHQRSLAFVKKEFTSAVVKRWSSDPLYLGAFLMFAPYQVSTWHVSSSNLVELSDPKLSWFFWDVTTK